VYLLAYIENYDVKNLTTQRVLEIDLVLVTVDGMIWKQSRNELPRQNTVLLANFLPQIPHAMTWIRSRAEFHEGCFNTAQQSTIKTALG